MHEVKQGSVKETWIEGLSMFHNPKALHPVDPGIFPNIAHHRFVDGQIESLLPEFHPYTSLTLNILGVDDEEFEKNRVGEKAMSARPPSTA